MQSTKTLTPISEKRSNEAFLKDLDKPDLQNLAYCLRHPETWPKGFVWDFKNCTTCAMGLARALWSEVQFTGRGDDNTREAVSVMAREFAMSFTDANRIFAGKAYGGLTPPIIEGHLWWRRSIIDYDAVTPEMVADEIDRYVAGAE